ncbi:MAG: erythromycin esterase family protein [Actinoplanes sp.]
MIELTTLDPTAPLDDLEPLRDRLAGARVVGIGESAHHVREYQLLRHRITRFLVERMGFTVFALESGFSEGLGVDRWVQGGAGGPTGLTYRFGESPETQAMLAWMRSVVTNGGTLSYAGLDLPGDLASMLPALDGVGRYLSSADPDAGILVGRIRKLAELYAGPHTMPAFAAYQAMAAADRDELTVLLAELSARFDALRPLYPPQFGTARHELRLAALLDQALRAQAAGATAVNVRDAAMAETVAWLLDRGAPGVVLSAANNHLQRIPFRMAGFEVPVLGAHLATRLGDDYVVIAGTARAGRTPSRRRAPSAPAGAELFSTDLPAPAPGSVESLLPSDGVAHVLDPRSLDTPPTSIRNLDGFVEQPVAEAFDLVAGISVISPTAPVE